MPGTMIRQDAPLVRDLPRYYCPGCGHVRRLGSGSTRIRPHGREDSEGVRSCPGGIIDKVKDAAP